MKADIWDHLFCKRELIWNKAFIAGQRVHAQNKSGIASCAEFKKSAILPYTNIFGVLAFDSDLSLEISRGN